MFILSSFTSWCTTVGYQYYWSRICKVGENDNFCCEVLDTDDMYNDFGTRDHYVRVAKNPKDVLEHLYDVNYSGCHPCMSCGQLHGDYEDEGGLVCGDCCSYYYCDSCGERIYDEDEYWLESINGGNGYGDVCIDGNGDYAFYSAHVIRGVDIDAYGKTWRCWDIKPSDEQRKNTPWKE